MVSIFDLIWLVSKGSDGVAARELDTGAGRKKTWLDTIGSLRESMYVVYENRTGKMLCLWRGAWIQNQVSLSLR